jgi:hypothetical protein
MRLPRTLRQQDNRSGRLARLQVTVRLCRLLQRIRGFTSFCEQRTPAEIFRTVSQFTERICQIIRVHGGHDRIQRRRDYGRVRCAEYPSASRHLDRTEEHHEFGGAPPELTRDFHVAMAIDAATRAAFEPCTMTFEQRRLPFGVGTMLRMFISWTGLADTRLRPHRPSRPCDLRPALSANWAVVTMDSMGHGHGRNFPDNLRKRNSGKTGERRGRER